MPAHVADCIPGKEHWSCGGFATSISSRNHPALCLRRNYPSTLLAANTTMRNDSSKGKTGPYTMGICETLRAQGRQPHLTEGELGENRGPQKTRIEKEVGNLSLRSSNAIRMSLRFCHTHWGTIKTCAKHHWICMCDWKCFLGPPPPLSPQLTLQLLKKTIW